jgi:hypothetical protein
MRTVILVLACLGVFPMSAWAQQSPANEALQEKIRKLDLAHANAIFKGDAATLDRLLPDDHTVNHPTNRIVQEKAELMRLIGDGTIRYTSFERRPERFLFYPGMVVVMGDETVGRTQFR